MDLRVRELDLKNFRSYEELRLLLDEQLTVLVGPNGVGKTNVIEALQLITTTQSFRRPAWGDVIRWGEQRAEVRLAAEGTGRVMELELSISNAGRREFKVNGKTKRRLAEVSGIVPSVVFTPDDLRLVKESAERRRSALDALGSQLSPSYARLSAEYDRVVRQRNAALKNEDQATQTLEEWTSSLATAGASLRRARARLFERLGSAITRAYAGIAEGELRTLYVPAHERDGLEQVAEASTEEESILAHVRVKAKEEQARGVSLAGPHRDEIVFLLDGRDARTFASQGQQRTIALAWKLAEVEVIKGVANRSPLLLLDDVMSELDEARRQALEAVVGRTGQTVVTTTNLGYFEHGLVERATVMELR